MTTPLADSFFTAEVPQGTERISFLKVPPPAGAPERQAPEKQ